MVEAKGLTKRFADSTIINGVHLEVFQGECFGIFGPNGAGKSTLMKTMYGSAAVETGELFITGLNARSSMREIKARIGVLPQDEGLDGDFTVRENLNLFGSYHGIHSEVSIQRTEDLLKLTRLEDLGDQDIHVLTTGMKRRLGIARALINQPEVLFLDEPTSGMDPASRQWVWDFLRQTKSEMGTVVLTTHYMEEAEKICDRIAIIDRGRILAVGKPADLIREKIGIQVVELNFDRSDLQYYLSRLSSEKFRYQVIGERAHVHLDSKDEVPKILNLVQSFKVTIRNPHLSDVFLKLAGYNLKDELL